MVDRSRAGWASKPLAQVATMQYGLSIAAHPEGRVPIVGMQHINGGCLRLEDLSRVELTEAELDQFKLNPGDVLFNRTNSADQVGKSAIYRGTWSGPIVFASYLVRFTANPTWVEPEYLALYLDCDRTVEWLRRRATPGVSQYNINPTTLGRELQVSLPPLDEQRRICAIAHTWEQAARVVESLLMVSRRLSRGLMQQLLTGHISLNNSNGTKWRTARIGDLLTEIVRPIEWDDSAVYRLLSLRRRSGGPFIRGDVSASAIKTKSMREARAGDLLISKMQAVHGAVGLVTEAFDKTKISGSYVALVPKTPEELDIRYFAYLTHLPEMYRAILRSCHGVHIEKMTFCLEDYMRIQVRIPRTREAQRAIADVLDCASKSIAQLERLHATLQKQRRELVDRLLTGKLRLTV